MHRFTVIVPNKPSEDQRKGTGLETVQRVLLKWKNTGDTGKLGIERQTGN